MGGPARSLCDNPRKPSGGSRISRCSSVKDLEFMRYVILTEFVALRERAQIEDNLTMPGDE